MADCSSKILNFSLSILFKKLNMLHKETKEYQLKVTLEIIIS